MGEPWPVATPQPFDEAIGQEGRHAVFGRAVRLAAQSGVHVTWRVMAERSQPLQPKARVAGAKRDRHVEARQNGLIGEQARVVRTIGIAWINTLVGVAKQRRCIASAAGRPGNVVEARVQGRAVCHHAMVQLIQTGIETGAPGTARRSLAVMSGEADALLGQAVEVGGLDQRVSSRR